jgi:copper resistance protein C
MQNIKVPFLVLILLLFITATALAHAHLRRSQPNAESTVHGSPSEVKLWFSEAVEPAYSSIEVTGDDGKQVDKGDTSVDPGDHKILKVSLSSLSPGTYTVVWRVTSIDTHKTQGKFTFKVVP